MFATISFLFPTIFEVGHSLPLQTEYLKKSVELNDLEFSFFFLQIILEDLRMD